jgi:hypothetical protein
MPYSEWLRAMIQMLGWQNRLSRWKRPRRRGTATRRARYNSEIECARQRAWRDAHPRYKAAYMRAWHARNPGYGPDYSLHVLLPKRIAAKRAQIAALEAELAS